LRRRTRQALRRSVYVALGLAYLVGSAFAVVTLSPSDRDGFETETVQPPPIAGYQPVGVDATWTLTDV